MDIIKGWGYLQLAGRGVLVKVVVAGIALKHSPCSYNTTLPPLICLITYNLLNKVQFVHNSCIKYHS